MKTALITGVNGGIGKQIFKDLKDDKWRLLGIDIQENTNLDLDCYVQIDLDKFARDSKYRSDKINNIENFLDGNLNALINNAALQIIKPFRSITTDDISKIFNINFVSPLLLCQILNDYLKRNKGSIINIGSIHSRLTKTNFSIYASTKAALSSLNRSLAIELAPNVSVNIINPGAIETKMLKSGFNNNKDYCLAKLKQPISDFGQPGDISKLILYLVNNKSSFVTGCEFNVDGAVSSSLYDM